MTRVSLLSLLAILQAIAGARVATRLVRTAGGERIATVDRPLPAERITVVVPVLNERSRLNPCLAGVIAQPAEIAEILVVDGGSCDGTQEVVAGFCQRDPRVRLIEGRLVPQGWNGKAHSLQTGLDAADPASTWILTIDADLRPAPGLARSLLAHARRTGVAALSVATAQRLSGAAEGLLHPALLTTLVYRFGIPGHTTRRVPDVQANGQCCLFRRGPLVACGGFRPVRASLCEDVTVARLLAANGYAVGFHETEGLAAVEMYAGWRETWQNWPRSLSLRDRFSGLAGWLGLAEVILAQGLPLPVLLLARRVPLRHRAALAFNTALLAMRLGILAGTARAYPGRPWTYWLSPLLDLPVTVRLWQSALRRRHTWRGRVLVRDDTRV